MKLTRIAACLALALAATADETVDDFESPRSPDSWSVTDGTSDRTDDPVKAGSGALRWRAAKEGSVLSTRRLKGDLTECQAVRCWMRLEGSVERTVEARLPAQGGLFWRRFTLRPGVWSEIVLPFYQFRSNGVPSWKEVEGLEFRLRQGPASVVIDDIALVEGGNWCAIEPTSVLADRIFGSAEHAMALTENVRVYTDAPLNAREVADRIEDGIVRFQRMFGLKEEPLEYPVTLIIRKTVDDYRRTAVETARDVYGGELRAPQAGGFTFHDYSFSSYDAEQGSNRPVYIHEACHQLVTRLLGFQGEHGATWIEEGICYLIQNEFHPQKDLGKLAVQLFEGDDLLPLSKFDGAMPMTGGANLQSLLVARYLLKGPHADKWGALREALLENKMALLDSVEDAWGVPRAEFEKEWEAFTRKWAEGR